MEEILIIPWYQINRWHKWRRKLFLELTDRRQIISPKWPPFLRKLAYIIIVFILFRIIVLGHFEIEIYSKKDYIEIFYK